MGSDGGERRRIRVRALGVAGVAASTDLADDQKSASGRAFVDDGLGRSRTDRDGARAPCGEPRATRGLWSFPEEVRPVRDREGCRDIGSGRGSRGSRRRAVIEPGGDTRGRSVVRLNPFLTGRGGSRGGVNAGAHLRGVAHDDHAVTARHGLDEAVHPSRSVCHCWRARVREPASFGLPRDRFLF